MISRARVKALARQGVSSLAYYSGYCTLNQLAGGGQGVRILCYHSICDRPASPFGVSAVDFDRQMRFLAQHFEVMSLDGLVALLRKRKPLPPRALAITIDDGYRDAYTHAFPTLKRYAIPATLFLPVRLIGSDPATQTGCPLPEKEFLSWDQVREMHQAGLEFGSHTLTHSSLTRLPIAEVRRELEYSKSKLEAELKWRINGLSYPYGRFRDWDLSVQECACSAGYSWAVTGISGVNRGLEDLYALRRTKVERDDGMRVFGLALAGALDPWVLIDRYGGFLQRGPR